jgi:hypothetical protein
VTDKLRHPASFRDPCGYLYLKDGVLLRQVEPAYSAHYECLMASGLYAALVMRGWLVAHEEVGLELAARPGAFRVLRPDPLPFISHPYEWSFGQLRAAGLRTLEVQRLALEHGMTLKDATAYNVQLRDHRPVLIDTLSFEIYKEGRPWVAYRQFCQHFLAPLALASYCDVRLLELLRSYIDGIPLDLASRLLPRRTRLRPGLYMHLHLHSRFQQRHADDAREGAADSGKRAAVSQRGLEGIVQSLESLLDGLTWSLPKTEWGDYYSDTNYSEAAFTDKRVWVAGAIEKVRPSLVFDMGANTAEFSRLASEHGIDTVAFDVDPVAVERAWRGVVESQEEHLLPLRLDLANPSPALGWAHTERASLVQRGPADLVLALALVHHLAIGNNVPLEQVADFFAELGRALVIEFVPKQDPQVQRLLATREDVFPDYDCRHFEAAFRRRFELCESHAIEGSERVLYRMARRGEAG